MCAYGMSVNASAYGCAYAHTCICVKAKGSVMPLCLPLSSCPPPPTLPLLSFTIVLPTCCYLLSFPFSHTYSLSLFFIPPPPPFLSLSSLLLPCLCMSVCVLWAASQDDGEVRAALGTSSQWRGLRPWDALAAISQGSPVIASPDGLQVTPGKRIDRPIFISILLMNDGIRTRSESGRSDGSGSSKCVW